MKMTIGSECFCLRMLTSAAHYLTRRGGGADRAAAESVPDAEIRTDTELAGADGLEAV